MADTVYEFEVTSINGTAYQLDQYRGKVVLIVNTASKCGYTYQYGGLQKLYDKFKERQFIILGFPCNQFKSQEPGSEDEIASFCQINHGVTFPLHAKIDVNGSGTHPLYEHLKAEAPGLLGTKAIKWNFTKFLIDTEGKVIKRYGPKDEPKAIAKDVEKLLPA
jgi:glutathione peroxidase